MVDIRVLHHVRADDRHEDQQHDNDPAAHGHFVAAQSHPGNLPERTALNCLAIGNLNGWRLARTDRNVNMHGHVENPFFD